MELHSELYQKLNVLSLSENDLQSKGFPRPDPSSSWTAKMYNLEASTLSLPPARNTRRCARCNIQYRVKQDGRPLTMETCRYHWGSQKPAEATCHVTSDLATNYLEKFVDTGEVQATREHEVVGLAYQLVYTLAGMEVVAVALVDSSCRVLYETLVLPEAPVFDYDTNNTGLELRHFKNVKTQFPDVQVKLASLLAPDTLLVGHGLSQALLRLRVIHHLILDTALLYPHPSGPPATYTLQDLTNKHLKGRTSTVKQFRCRNEATTAMMLARRLC